MMDKEKLERRLIGYRETYRGRLLLLRNKILTKEEFILYEGSLDFADWDKKNHSNIYGSFCLTWKEIAFLLGWNESSVSRHGNRLLEKNLWERRADGRIQVRGFELIEIGLLREIVAEGKIVDLEKYLAKMQTPLSKTQEEIAKTQDVSPKGKEIIQPQNLADLQEGNHKGDLVSSKDKFIVSPEVERELEEYGEQKWGKDALCFCGSGEKFWNCCKLNIEDLINDAAHCKAY